MKAKVLNMIQSGAQVVDVRSPVEFAGGAYPGAVNIPLDQIEARLHEFGERARNIVLYCASGARSGMAESILRGAGFENVINGGGLFNMPRV